MSNILSTFFNAPKWIVKDWAGNILNHEGKFVLPQLAVPMEFSSFEDAWDWIFENMAEEDYCEVSAEPVSLR